MMSHGIGRYHLISFDVRHSGPLLKSYCGTIALLEFPHKCISTSEFFQKAPKGALRPFSVAALLHYSFMVRFGIFCCQQDFLPRFT